MSETHPIMVTIGSDRTEGWSIEKATLAAHRSYRLTLRALDEQAWSAVAADVFTCLLELRSQVEPLGVRLCCNGSRRNAWPFGMQRDMGQGLVVYLLSLPRSKERPLEVDTLGPAPSNDVVSVAEQRAWFEAWRKSTPGDCV